MALSLAFLPLWSPTPARFPIGSSANTWKSLLSGQRPNRFAFLLLASDRIKKHLGLHGTVHKKDLPPFLFFTSKTHTIPFLPINKTLAKDVDCRSEVLTNDLTG